MLVTCPEPLSTTNTCVPAGFTITVLAELGETESTVPGTVPLVVTALLVRSTTINALVLPRYALAAFGAITSEFGLFGRVMAVPALFVAVSMGTSDVPVVLATNTVVAEVPVVVSVSALL